MTLTFVPKLILVVVAFGLLANFMMVQLSDYFSFIFDQVAQARKGNGRHCTLKSWWCRGFARSEPAICHGVTGNSVFGSLRVGAF